MSRWLVLLFALFIFSQPLLAQPRPLPDDPYPSEPYPGEPPHRTEVLYSIGFGKTGRFGTQTYQFFARSDLRHVTRLRLVGSRNGIEIKKVRLVYADYSGDRIDPMLSGDLRAGGVLETFLDGRPLSRIEVTASSSYFWKKPGSYRVDIWAY